jgi:hypothetical protein
MSDHTIHIPDSLWKWAQESRSTEGPGWFLRNVLTEAMRQSGNGHNLKKETPKKETPKTETEEKGKAVHQKCYIKMSEVYEVNHPDNELPPSTPIVAKRRTICPYCRNHVVDGDDVVMTTMSEWK